MGAVGPCPRSQVGRSPASGGGDSQGHPGSSRARPRCQPTPAGHHATRSPCHPVTVPPGHCATGHRATQSPCHPVTMPPSHHAIGPWRRPLWALGEGAGPGDLERAGVGAATPPLQGSSPGELCSLSPEGWAPGEPRWVGFRGQIPRPLPRQALTGGASQAGWAGC